uniref:Elongator complex protein 2 n=1 Tax=Steinernema glaseri TaxID=37863 RepID=A0A1I7ZGL4_9BILA
MPGQDSFHRHVEDQLLGDLQLQWPHSKFFGVGRRDVSLVMELVEPDHGVLASARADEAAVRIAAEGHRTNPIGVTRQGDSSFELLAVLSGHEGWVHSVQWHPTVNRLLSASIDKCLIVWEPSEGGSGVWLEKVRVGEVGGQAVGYYGGIFANEGSRIVGHSYFGGIYVWHPENEEPSWSRVPAIRPLERTLPSLEAMDTPRSDAHKYMDTT